MLKFNDDRKKILSIVITVFLLYFFFSFYLNLTIWGEIYKVKVFEILYNSNNYISNIIFPLISFNINLGFPTFADSESGIFEPINFISSLILKPINQINFNYFSHLLLYSVGLFFLLRNIYKIDSRISLLSSILLIFSPLNIGDSIHQYHIALISYMPIALILIEVYLLKNKFLFFFILFPFIICFQLLAGHYQYQLYCFVFLSLYVVLSILLNFQDKKNTTKLLIFAVSISFGFALASPQLIPSLDLMMIGDRSNFQHTYLGSAGLSSLGLFYKPLSITFNSIHGSIPTLGYIIIFFFSFNKIADFIIKKKNTLNKLTLKIFIIFFFLFGISLGENFYLNKILYKLIPFMENFRFPARAMQISSFCTIILLAISLDDLLKFNFKFKRANIIFIIIILTFLGTFLHFYKYIKIANKINISNLNDLILIFYPFLLIITLYVFLRYIKKNTFKILIFITIISIIENFFLLFSFPQYSLLLNKDLIYNSQNIGSSICKYSKTNSINIVGEFSEKQSEYYLNLKNYKYLSPITSDNCKVFYHHNRNDVVKKGLGYNQSSLTTKNMIYLSEYQNKYQNKLHSDYFENEFKYTASLVQYFVRSKTLYTDVKNNLLKDDLYIFDNEYILNFIRNYQVFDDDNFFDKIRVYLSPFIIKNLNNSKIARFFPKIKNEELKLLNYNDKINFIPIWQSKDYYYEYNKKFYSLEKFSFGHKIEKNIKEFQIYYIPISFILGLILSIFAILIIISIFIKFLVSFKKII
jgi:hypothetical protein